MASEDLMKKVIKSELVRGSLALLFLINLGNFFSYLFQFFMARMLGPAEYGIFAVLTSITYILTIPAISVLTRVLMTIGRTPSVTAAVLTWRTKLWAFSTESMNGTVISFNRTPSNWVSRLCPSISAVIPVRSETKNAVRCEFMLGTGVRIR